MNRRHGSLMDVDDFLVGERWGGFDCEAIEGKVLKLAFIFFLEDG